MPWQEWSELRWILLGWLLAITALAVALRYMDRWQRRHDTHDPIQS